jgi:membrane peptidoglycan carboxypeptidase
LITDDSGSITADLSIKDLLQGRIQVYSTVDARVQQIVNEALEHGLELYEKRHPSAKGLIQGSVVVLRNRDASTLAEMGGRFMTAPSHTATLTASRSFCGNMDQQ